MSTHKKYMAVYNKLKERGRVFVKSCHNLNHERIMKSFYVIGEPVHYTVTSEGILYYRDLKAEYKRIF